jgi:hypothetical protein
MRAYVVTVKLARNLNHDPKNKLAAECPAGPYADRPCCTDSTGEHHSFLTVAEHIEQAAERFTDRGYHVTRVETARFVQ